MCIYFWVLNSFPLVYLSIFLPILYCFYYHHFVVSFESRECVTFDFILFSEDCFVYSGSFEVPYKSDNFCPISLKNVIGISNVIALNLYIALANMDILTMLILPIHEHEIFFHFIVSFSIFLIMICSFKYMGPSHSLLSLFLGILLGL